MFLTDAQILDIVKPLTQPAAIVRWFVREGFTVKVRPNGMPLISSAHYEAVMTAQEVKPVADGSNVGLNVVALKKALNYGDGQKTQKQPARAT